MMAGDYYTAIAVMKPLVESSPERETPARQEVTDDDTIPDLNTGTDSSFGSLSKLPVKERAEISRSRAQAYEKTGALEQAVSWFRSAYKLEPGAAEKSQINKEVQQLRAVLRRRASNEARQLLVHSELEQNRAVRPRLPDHAMASPPPGPAGAAKGVSR